MLCVAVFSGATNDEIRKNKNWAASSAYCVVRSRLFLFGDDTHTHKITGQHSSINWVVQEIAATRRATDITIFGSGSSGGPAVLYFARVLVVGCYEMVVCMILSSETHPYL